MPNIQGSVCGANDPISSKDNCAFFYRTPCDRLQKIMQFGWCAIWNGNWYANDYEINLSHNELQLEVAKIIEEIQQNYDECCKLYKTDKEQKGLFDPDNKKRAIELVSACIQHSGFAAENLRDLIRNLSSDPLVPGIVQDAIIKMQ